MVTMQYTGCECTLQIICATNIRGVAITECTLSILNKSSATDLRMEIVMLCNLLFGGTASLIAHSDLQQDLSAADLRMEIVMICHQLP